MKNNLKISVITLTLLLAAISFVFSISAAEKTYGDFEYKVENDNVTVTKYLGEDIDVTIPETIDGLPVTSVGKSSFLSKIKIESINLPPTIKYIEYGAFAGCSRLKTINLPEGVIKIDNCAFEACSELDNVIVPATTEYIGDSAFVWCKSLTNIQLPDTPMYLGSGLITFTPIYEEWKSQEDSTSLYIGKHLLNTKNIKGEYKIEEGTLSAASFSFSDNNELTKVVFPDTVKMIGSHMFISCGKLTEVIFSDEITAITQSAFEKCTSLEKIKLPQNIVSIAQNAFYECTNLTEVYIPKSVTVIEKGAFYQCKKIKVYYYGTEEEWKLIEVTEKENAYFVDAPVCFNYAPGQAVTEESSPQTEQIPEETFDIPEIPQKTSANHLPIYIIACVCVIIGSIIIFLLTKKKK